MGSNTHSGPTQNLANRPALATSRLIHKKRASRLLLLPRELRDQIYVYVLASPTGYIFPYPDYRKKRAITNFKTSLKGLKENVKSQGQKRPQYPLYFWHATISTIEASADFPQYKGTVNVSLLQTCTQIHAEARYLFYTLNTFILPFWMLEVHKTPQPRLVEWLRHVGIWGDLLAESFEARLMCVKRTLGNFQGWGKAGVLESVTLSFTRRRGQLAALATWKPLRWAKLIDLLREDNLAWEAIAQTLTRASHPSRSVQTDEAPGICEGGARKKRVRRRLEISNHPVEGMQTSQSHALNALRDAWGGELWLDDGTGELSCWKG